MTKTVRILLLSACFAGTLAAQSRPRMTLEVPRNTSLTVTLENKTWYMFMMDSAGTLTVLRYRPQLAIADEKLATPSLCQFEATGIILDDSLTRYCPDSSVIRSAKFPEFGWIVIHGPAMQNDSHSHLRWPKSAYISLDPFFSSRMVKIEVGKLACAIPNPEDCL